MKSIIFLFVIVTTSVQLAQIITRQEIEEINQAVTNSFGTDYGVSTIVPFDRIEKTIGQYGYAIEDSYTLRECFLFIAYTKIPEDDYNTYGLIGIYKNGSIIWNSDPVIKWEFLSQTSIPSIMDINKDGIIDIIILCYSGGDAQLADIWILSWNGSIGWFINGIDGEGFSVMKQGGAYTVGILDASGDGIMEICMEDECYYWNGSLYSNSFPFPEVVPKDRLTTYVKCFVSKPNNVFKYDYEFHNDSSSLQKIALFGMDNKSENVFNFRAPTDWDFSISGGFDFLEGNIKIPEWNYSNAFIISGETKTGFSFSSSGLPTITNIYFQGYNTDPDFDKNKIISNSFNTYTLGVSDSPDPLIPSDFLDTLLNYNTRSFELGWIKNQPTASKYDSLFTLAKTQLQQNNNNAAKATLQTVLQQVDIDSTNNLTSEAYALIRYNTEYLISKIPDQSLLNVAAINPAMSLVNPGSFTMEVKGAGFTASSVVYFNGNARITTFVADTLLTAEIQSSDVSVAGNYPVWVSDGTTNSDTLTFSVVSTLPNPVRPVLECVRNNGNGTFTAYFGYKNENDVSVYIPVGNKNKFTPTPQDRGQTRVFLPGRKYKVFTVNFNGSNLVWTLNGRTSTASANSAPCQ